jgi:NitT/TauT family transport system ATP-binding protein
VASSRSTVSPFAKPLPHVRVGGISGLLELVAEKGEGRSSIPQLAQRLQLEVDDLLPLLDASGLLGFAEVADGDVQLTAIGRDFATTTILRSKDLFRQQALGRVPVLSSNVHTLQEKENRAMRSEFFLGIWDDYFPLEEAERQLATAVDWGRYGELFEFDATEGRLYLPS